MSINIKARNKAFDSLKAFAAFIVFSTHFWDFYDASVFHLYWEFPTSIVLGGLNGKFGVALFGVLVGYFALSEGFKNTKSITEYSVKRYVYFLVSCILVNLIYIIMKGYPIYGAFIHSFSLSGDIFAAFWCIPSFMIASVVCFIFGKLKIPFLDCLVISILLVLCGYLWTGICTLGGSLIWFLMDKPVFKKAYIQIIMYLIAHVLIRLEESLFAYFIYGLCAVVFVILCNNVCWLNRILSNPVTSSLGKNSISIYLIHEVVYLIAGKMLIDYSSSMGLSVNAANVISWLGSWIIICLLSYPMTAFIRFIMKEFSVLYDAVKKRLLKTSDPAKTI